jgi:transposase
MAREDPGAEVFFFDEARFGAKPELGRRRAGKGGRPVAVVRPGYKSFYVYSAVCPATGEDAALLLPWVNTDMMNLFLGRMARRLKGRRCILVMDRAGWHVSRGLRVPPNIRIVLLPPYSPELNPVERLWQWPRRHAVRNRLHLTLESVMDAVSRRLRKTTAEFFRSICRCGYLSCYK